jgi:hypothetical protein
LPPAKDVIQSPAQARCSQSTLETVVTHLFRYRVQCSSGVVERGDPAAGPLVVWVRAAVAVRFGAGAASLVEVARTVLAGGFRDRWSG